MDYINKIIVDSEEFDTDTEVSVPENVDWDYFSISVYAII